MINQYFAECPSGHRIPVELYQSGIRVNCPSCNFEVVVPDTMTLKINSGDKYPLLAPIEKIRRQIAEQDPPFDGICAACRAASANETVRFVFKSLVEQQFDNDDVVKFNLLSVNLHASGGQQYWDVTELPLMLCTPCFERFEAKHRYYKLKRGFVSFLVISLLVVFLIFAYFQMEVVAALSGVLWFIGLIAWIASLQSRNKIDVSAKFAMEKINWLKEAVAESLEAHLSVQGVQHHSQEA